MSKPVPAFRTTNWSSYGQALKRRGSLMVWFDPDISWFAAPSGKSGHPERFSALAIQFCLSLKVLFGLPLRQTTGFVESLLALSGLDWPVPDYTTLCRRQKHLEVQIPYRATSGPLHLLVDSTGIKFSGEGEWQVPMAQPIRQQRDGFQRNRRVIQHPRNPPRAILGRRLAR